MKKKNILFSCALLFLPASGMRAQGVVAVQPKIMVLPYIKQGEDYRTILEEDVNKRIALSKVKESFDREGFTTVDFVQKLKNLSQAGAFQSDNQNDIKKMMVEQSGADIYVEAELDIHLAHYNYVNVILTAYEVSTANSLANKIGRSGENVSTDIGRLAEAAVRNALHRKELPSDPDFLQTMQLKFEEMIANGRSIIVDFGFLNTSLLSMDSEVGSDGNLLKDEIELWMEDNAYKNQYHIQGTVASKMLFDDVRIPLRDPVTGQNYSVNKFLMRMRKFLRGLGLTFEENVNGSVIYINFK